MNIVGILVGGIALGGTFGFAAASRSGTSAKGPAPSEPLTCSAGGAQPGDSGLVEVNGKKFTREDLPQDIRSALYETEHESHEKMAGALKEFALRLALASEKDSKVSPDKLPPLQELLPPSKPDEATMKSLYEANKAQMPPGTTFEQVKPQIEQYLARQSTSTAMQGKMAELEKAGKIKILVQEPIPPVVTIDLEGFPSQGPKDAVVTVVEASDYLCPHCQRMQPEVEAAVKEFDGKIRFVQANFALNPEGLSGMLAQGAFCAQKQSLDAFWKFHHEAFGAKQVPPAEAQKETIALAEKAGVKNADFEKCLGSDEAKSFVSKSVERMSAVGVTGTPTFFINGRKMGHGGTLKESIAKALTEAR
jgi:protein-disulfide isomerase